MNSALIAKNKNKKLALLLVQHVFFAWCTQPLTPPLSSELAFEGNAWVIY
jgi:hypothetical protein